MCVCVYPNLCVIDYLDVNHISQIDVIQGSRFLYMYIHQ